MLISDHLRRRRNSEIIVATCTTRKAVASRKYNGDPSRLNANIIDKKKMNESIASKTARCI